MSDVRTHSFLGKNDLPPAWVKQSMLQVCNSAQGSDLSQTLGCSLNVFLCAEFLCGKSPCSKAGMGWGLFCDGDLQNVIKASFRHLGVYLVRRLTTGSLFRLLSSELPCCYSASFSDTMGLSQHLKPPANSPLIPWTLKLTSV